MKINQESSSDDARIEIIPLIDVIFCILTFFILASLQLTRQQAISVDLPKAGTGVPQMRDMLLVSLDDLGQVYIEQQLMSSKEQLNQALKNYSITNPTGLMVLYASKSVSYNEVVQLLDLLRQVGGSRVALATLPGSGNAPNSPNILQPNSGVPGLTPYTGASPNLPANTSPYGLPNSAPTFNPVVPPLPNTSGQPGILPVNPQLPITPTLPTPGNSNATNQQNPASQR